MYIMYICYDFEIYGIFNKNLCQQPLAHSVSQALKENGSLTPTGFDHSIFFLTVISQCKSNTRVILRPEVRQQIV